MNIKEHIEAGHYPNDEKGRALVPCEGPEGTRPLITIYATDHGTSFPICGRHPECADAETYSSNGVNLGSNGDLLPPPPRKVKVSGCYVAINQAGVKVMSWSRALTDRQMQDYADCRIVELTGEYEEPWS